MQTESPDLELGVALPDRIGGTPLIRLDKLAYGLEGVTLLAKAEWLNPGGSVKDRAAAAMVRKARGEGNLGPGRILLDATSGNTGIALAMLGAAKGFPVRLAMPSNVSPERKHILKAYGAQVDWTDPDKGSDGAIRRARELAGNEPRAFVMWISIRTTQTGEPTTRARGEKSGSRLRPCDSFCGRTGHERNLHGDDTQT